MVKNPNLKDDMTSNNSSFTFQPPKDYLWSSPVRTNLLMNFIADKVTSHS